MNSTSPVQVVQVLPGSQTAVGFGWGKQAPDDSDTTSDQDIPIEQMGDPALTLVPPSDQFRTSYTFLTPDTYERNFVNVLHRLGDDIYLDGIEIQSSDDLERVMKVHEEPIGQSDWHLTIVEVSAGPHFMSNPSGDAFGIMVYAYDRDVSYAFPGGLNLLKR